MSRILELLFIIMNAYTSQPRDPVLIVRNGAVRGAIAFGGPGVFLAVLGMIIKPQAHNNLLQHSVLVVTGYISTACSLAASLLLLVCAAFLVRILYSYINPAAFDYHRRDE